MIEGVEAPTAIDHTDLEEHAMVRIRSGRGILFQMKPALFSIAAIRAENSFPGECRSAGKRMDVDEKAIVHAVELDGLSGWRINDVGMPDNRRRMAADFVETIEDPDLLARTVLGSRGYRANQDQRC